MAKHKNESGEPIRRKKRLLFTGVTMGLADLIPGVSGGTIAFLFGIYDELLYTIKLMTGQVPRLILKGKFRAAFNLIPFGFVLPLGLGILLAIFGLVQIVSYLLENQPLLVWSLFFGLVLGSAYVVSKRVTKWTLSRVGLLLLGFGLTFVIVGLPAVGGSDSPLAVFTTGAVAITAMILPGISGSLIMVLLGQYEIIIDAVADRNLLLLAFFAAGAIIGLGLFVRLLTWLLKHYHLAVIAFLIGVMVGSLRRIWPWQIDGPNGTFVNSLPVLELSLVWAVVLMVTGFGLVFMLEKAGIAKEHDDIKTADFNKEFKEIEG
jgi:putative membrane protein